MILNQDAAPVDCHNFDNEKRMTVDELKQEYTGKFKTESSQGSSS